MNYGSFYPTFRSAAQAGKRLGWRLRRAHPAAMPGLRTRFDHRSRPSPQAGPRRVSRRDWDPSRSLSRLREDLHLPAVAFAPLHPLPLAGSLPGLAAALRGALLWGRGGAHAERPPSPARSLDTPPLGPRSPSLSTRPFLSTPNAGPRRSLAGTPRSGRLRSRSFVGGASDSASPLALAALRNFPCAHHPCLGTLPPFS
jgi:hypothetical protein